MLIVKHVQGIKKINVNPALILFIWILLLLSVIHVVLIVKHVQIMTLVYHVRILHSLIFYKGIYVNKIVMMVFIKSKMIERVKFVIIVV
jgi:hypothetical protein